MGIGHRVSAALAAATGLAVLGAAPALAATTSYPNDYFFAKGQQWALTGAAASINAPAAWCRSTGSGIKVGMVDTGVDFSHPDLQGKVQVGAAFTGGSATTDTMPTGTDQASVTDQDGHGTVTAGAVVADTNNATGIAAVAPDATAVAINVRGSDGTIFESDVALGIEWAADHGDRVINVSIEPGQISASKVNVPDLTIPAAASYARQRGSAVVLSAGNDGKSAPYPNLSGTALVAGALTPSGTMASYSNSGSSVSIYAPGGSTLDKNQMNIGNSIVSTFMTSSGYQYAIADGTSLSAPMVSGTLAVLMSTNLSNTAAMSAITSNAVTSADGHPQLDSARALGVSDSERCGTPSTPPPGGPPPVQKGGGTTTTTVTSSSTSRRATTTAVVHSTSTVAQQTQSQVATTATSTTSSDTSNGAQAGGDDVGQGGHSGTLPPASTPGPGRGGLPAPLVLAGLGVLLAGGAPLGLRLARRGRSVAR